MAAAALLGHSMGSPKELASVVADFEKFSNESPEDVRTIWTQFHADERKMRVGAVLSPEEFALLSLNATKSPMFVLPLVKSSEMQKAGSPPYLSVLLQMQLPYVLFTPLGDYQTMGDAAAPFMSIVYYSELSDSKGVVLCRGDVLTRAGGEAVSMQEARSLLELVHSYYLDLIKYKQVVTMNHDPMAFNFEAVVDSVLDEHNKTAADQGEGDVTSA